MTDGENFGMWIKQRRRELDLTQEMLATRVGCATVTIKKLENGQYRPSRQILSILARELHIPTEGVAEFIRRGRADWLIGEASNPYKGLLPFEEEDTEAFFGREALVERLLRRLADPGLEGRFLVITGPSGSGKSSLVRAGLIPALRRSSPPGATAWAIAYVTLGPQPISDLALALQSLVAVSSIAIQDALHRKDGLRNIIQDYFPPGSGAAPLLVIDPLETLFGDAVSEPSRIEVIAQLCGALADPSGSLHVICTLRADYYDRPLHYPALAQLIQPSTAIVIPMTPDETARAVREPAERVGVQIEPELLATIAAEMRDRPGALPLLQYALREAFDRRSTPRLRLEDFREIGGLTGALERRAEQIFLGLDAEGQAIARQMFLRLVTFTEGGADTRRRVSVTEFDFTASVAQKASGATQIDRRILAIVEQFVEHRILTLDLDYTTGTQTVDLAHEALLASWQRLRDWIETDREQLRTHRRLTVAATAWAQADFEPGLLPSGAALAQFEALAVSGELGLTSQERAYLAAAVAQRDVVAAAEEARRTRELALAQTTAQAERRAADRLRWLVGALLLFLSSAVALSLFAVRQRQVAETNLARAEAQRLAAEAIALAQRGVQHELVALLSLASLQLQRTPQGEQALDLALTLDYPLHLLDGHEDLISAVTFSPDGTLALTGDAAGRVRVWNPDAGEGVRTLGVRRSAITAFVLLSDRQRVVTGAEDGVLQILSISGEVLQTWLGHVGAVRNLQALANGQLLSVGDDGFLRLWDPGGSAPAAELHPAVGPLIAAIPDPHSDEVLIVARSGALLRWDRSSGQARARERAPVPVTAAALDRQSGDVALAGTDGRIVLIGGATGDRRAISVSEGALLSLAFSPDGRWLAAGGVDTVVHIISLPDMIVVRRLAGSTVAVEALAFAPDGRTLLTASGSSARIWQIDSPNPFRPVQGHLGAVTSAAFLPSRRLALTGGADGCIQWWDLSTGQTILSRDAHAGAVSRIVVSPDGRFAASGAADGQVRLWNTADGKPLRALQLAEPVIDLAIAPDGGLVAAIGTHGTVALWDSRRGTELRRWTSSYERIYAVTFSPDGSLLLTATDGVQVNDSVEFLEHAVDGTTVRTWAVDSGVQRSILALQDHRLFSLSTSNGLKRPGLNRGAASLAAFGLGEGLLVAAYDNSVQLWDSQRGAVAQTFLGHSNAVSTLAFREDGAVVATGSADGTARVWAVSSGAELRRLTSSAGTITAVAIASTGDYLITGSDRGVVRLWRVGLEQAIGTLCERLDRDLRPDERAGYAINEAVTPCPARRGEP